MQELEMFRKEEEASAQFFYAYQGIHAAAHDNKDVEALLNTAPLFWMTCAGALQTAAFIALGRVFDQDSTHNLDRVLRVAQDNPHIFSKEALARRKQGNSAQRPDWIDEYMRGVYEPVPADFRRLRAHVRKRRRIYENNYRDVRNRFFAHKELSDKATAVLFTKGSNRELQQLHAFLGSLYESLWQLFFNGRKPVLRPLRYSVKRMRDLPSPFLRSRTVQEDILHEAEKFLSLASKNVLNDQLQGHSS
jgi:hypothetical protein